MLYYKIIRILDLSEEEINNARAQLSSEQLKYINSLCEKRKIQSLAARTALYLLINEHRLNISVSSLTFDKSGKPIFNDSNYFVSLTHSEDYVGCAVSDAPVGIDIERVKPIKESVLNRVCNDAEQMYININGLCSFFTIWTLKEAYIKANGFSCSKLSQIETVINNSVSIPDYSLITGDIHDYKWSIIKKAALTH